MDIQQRLTALGESRVTPAVLNALDYVVPGEWENITSLEQGIHSWLGVTDPTDVAAIKVRALELWAAEPHYARAIKIYEAVDTADKAAAAAVAAQQLGKTFSLLSLLEKFTPKADTTQAIDAALKLVAEVVAFATLRGIPVQSLADAKTFPATLATYAKADRMRLAAWIAIDGLLPLGPGFVDKVVGIVGGVDASALAANPILKGVSDQIPGGTAEEQKGFIMGALASASSFVSEFVSARGLTREGIAGKVGAVMQGADGSLDVLASILDVSTDYMTHTGIQSVARVLVHDAQESLAAGEVMDAVPVADGEDAEEDDEPGTSWFKTAAMATGAAGLVGAAGVAVAGAAAWSWWNKEDPEDAVDDDTPDDELDQLDENQLAAREQALEMEARQMMASGEMPDAQTQQRMMRQRRRLRRARRMRMRQRRQQMGGRMGMGRGGGRGMGGGRGGGGGGGGMGGGRGGGGGGGGMGGGGRGGRGGRRG